MSADPLRHILRPALPWRDPTLTRCGRPVAELRPELLATFDEAKADVKRLGQRRAAFAYCMVCADGTSGWPEWATNPIGCLDRYLAAAGGRWSTRGAARSAERDRVEAELRAIAALIDQHRADFDAAVAALLGEDDAVVSLEQRRRDGGPR